MKKLALVIGSLAAVVLLALLVGVADGGRRDLPREPAPQTRHPEKPSRPGYLAGDSYSCRLEEGWLVVSYTYGASQRVAPFVDARGRGLVVGVEVQGPGQGVVVPAIALLGEARFARFGEPAWIRRPDGTELPCLTAEVAP